VAEGSAEGSTRDPGTPAGDGEVVAAGGLVWRRRDGRAEVLVVHRPRYDDWSFPKGKVDPGETERAAALREVAEETGLACRTGAELATVRYLDRQGRPKRVRYWLMEPEGGRFEPSDEVDAVRWLDAAAAPAVLSYDDDRRLLAASGLPPGGS